MDKLDPIFIEFLNYCPQAFEEMKQEESLCDLAEKVVTHNLSLEYKRDFLSTFHKKVIEHFKDNREFLKAYDDEKQRPDFTKKFEDYALTFLHYIEHEK